MRFLIIAFHSRNMTPYSKAYEQAIKDANCDYDILFWDRFTNAPLEKRGNEYIFHRICTLGGNRIKKIWPFYLFRKQVISIIKKSAYDKIIVLNTMPGFLIIHDVLLEKYKNKFILDIRDYTYEKYRFYYQTVRKLIESSYFTAISSPGFRKFLKDSPKLVINHNIGNCKSQHEIAENLKKEKIVIGFIGLVRFFDVNQRLIDSLANNPRFQLRYIGEEAKGCNLRAYCDRKKYNNVIFWGKFQNNDKNKLYEGVDIINSVYGNATLEVQTALPNRLYDCLLLKKPILVTNNTYLAKIVKQYGVGLILDPNDSYADKIAEYVEQFNPQEFNDNATQLLEVVEREQCCYYSRIKDFIESN